MNRYVLEPDRASLVGDRYALVRSAGSWGTASLFVGRQIGIGRPVLIKVLARDGHSRATWNHFRSQAGVIRQLVHPNTEQLYDFGETNRGDPYVVLELVKGKRLEDVLRHRQRLPETLLLRVAEQVLRSLVEAHGLGLTHGNLAPRNLMLCSPPRETDFIKVLSFGLDLFANHRPSLSHQPGIEGVGKASALSRERARAGIMADLYMLALTLCELATGSPPTSRVPRHDLLQALLCTAPVSLPEDLEAPSLAPILQRALDPLGPDRFESTSEMLDAVLAASVACARRDCALPVALQGRLEQAPPGRSSNGSRPTPSPSSSPPGPLRDADTRPVPIQADVSDSFLTLEEAGLRDAADSSDADPVEIDSGQGRRGLVSAAITLFASLRRRRGAR